MFALQFLSHHLSSYILSLSWFSLRLTLWCPVCSVVCHPLVSLLRHIGWICLLVALNLDVSANIQVFLKLPPSLPLNTSYSPTALFLPHITPLISHRFTNPCPFYFSFCFYAIHELSPCINFGNLIFKALEPGCYDISDNKPGSQNVRVWILDFPNSFLIVGLWASFLNSPCPSFYIVKWEQWLDFTSCNCRVWKSVKRT